MIAEVDVVKADYSFVVGGVGAGGVALNVLLLVQVCVLQHPLHSVHVVLNISHKLDNPSKVDGNQKAKYIILMTSLIFIISTSSTLFVQWNI